MIAIDEDKADALVYWDMLEIGWSLPYESRPLFMRAARRRYEQLFPAVKKRRKTYAEEVRLVHVDSLSTGGVLFCQRIERRFDKRHEVNGKHPELHPRRATYACCAYCFFLLLPVPYGALRWTDWRRDVVNAHTNRCALRYILHRRSAKTGHPNGKDLSFTVPDLGQVYL